MTIEQQDTPRNDTQKLDGPGGLLRAGREARGLSQQEVASRLNLRLSLVRDIEQDRFDQSTASTFTRGYLKTYAKLVGVPEEQVVAAYERMGFTEVKYAEMHSFSGRTRLEANENRFRLFSWLLFIGLGVGVLYYILAQPAEKPTVVTMSEQTLPQQDGMVPVQVEPQAEAITASLTDAPAEDVAAVASDEELRAESIASVASSAKPLVVSPQVSAAVGATSPPATTLVSAAMSTATVADPVPATSSASATIAALTGDLVLSFSGDCWLKVVDATGKVLLEGVRKPGQQQALSGQAPFKLTVGAPKAVAITFQGQPVDMKLFPVGRVARFELPLKN